MENQILEVLSLQKSALLRLSTSSATERIEKLRKIESYLMQHKNDLCDALYTDFKKSVVLSSGCITNVNITVVASWAVPAA